MEINYFRAAHSNNFISGLILWVLFFALVLGFIFHVLLGIFFLILFIGQFAFFKGSIIDFENKSIVLFNEYLWVKTKSPLTVSNYKEYKIKQVIKASSFSSRASSATVKQNYYRLDIINTEDGQSLLIATDDKKSINKLALRLEEVFSYTKRD